MTGAFWDSECRQVWSSGNTNMVGGEPVSRQGCEGGTGTRSRGRACGGAGWLRFRGPGQPGEGESSAEDGRGLEQA